MSNEATPSRGRAEAFADKIRADPLGEPPGGQSITGAILRIGMLVFALAALAFAFLLWTTSTCGCTPRPNFPASPAVGVVLSVDAQGLGSVRGFDLRTDQGVTHFQVGTLENPTEFPPAHLAEHQASSSPVRVYFRVENGGYVAVVYRLEDAGEPGPT